MNWLDLGIIISYILGFLFLGNLFKNNKDSKDYFLGGKSMGWFPLSLSTMATQLSAISFISAPAFVGLKLNGGLQWLSFEFAVPLAMIFIMIVIIPPLFRSGIVSIYEYIERKYDYSTRVILSTVFQISRALSTGVMVYTIAFILQAVLGISFVYTILIISVITIIYSWQGGMKAVVWGDAIQMILLFAGLIICLFYGYQLVTESGGFDTNYLTNRSEVIKDNFGLGKGSEYGLWPMLLGGFFLYASYYGCDQTQAQRMLSAKNEKTIKQLILANGLLRFPVVLVYCLMGLVLGQLVFNSPEFLAAIEGVSELHFPKEYETSGLKADLMVPIFIIEYLPHGVIGLLMVGILSAAMSSLSSTINSLSAVTLEDFITRGNPDFDQDKYMWYSKLAVVFWGVVCIACAFLFGGSDSPVIEIINAIGSVFYGPVLATFALAILSKKISPIGMKMGIVIAVIINLFLSEKFQDIMGTVIPALDFDFEIFWIWLNFTGFFLTIIIAYVVSMIQPKVSEEMENAPKFALTKEMVLSKEVLILFGFFVLVLIFSYFLPSILI